ncbi:MAG TPA: long-chain-fatty-acid--CoA ligase, partial [Myxococcaceae bacterium]|nr:long-chain-fatty-acid--CoA ligase [Myxococcaceae bacterium]
GFRHFELYYGVAGRGAVIHTINPRLSPDQIAYIANDAEDKYLCFDITCAALVEKLAPRLEKVKGFIALTDRAHMPREPIRNLLCYEDLLENEPAEFEWPTFDERTAAALCYTSGTTGHPKGALYGHRSTLLHAFAASLPDVFGLSARDVALPVVPMFHVNAWGLPYSCALTGTKLVFPGPHLDGKSLHQLFESEAVTLSAGVPTVWFGLLNYMKESGQRFSTLKSVLTGGSACPPAMIRTFQEEYGVEVRHAWGMTEMSPIGTVGRLKAKQRAMGEAQRYAVQAKQGFLLFGVDMMLADERGRPQPWDGKSAGEILVRGPWVVREYFKGAGGDPLRRGEDGTAWFPTGDVGTLDSDGYLAITDRAKDMIKSGGEWISSIELENLAVAHPAVAEAAVIGIKHPKWGERPLLVAVKRPGQELSTEELLRVYEGKVARWCVPDEVVFVSELPHTATGKLSKLTLRQQFADYRPAST